VNFKNGIFILSVTVMIVIGLASCNMKPTPGKTESDVAAVKPDCAKNEFRPGIVKDANGNMTERRDVTLGPDSKVRTRNEYHYTYDSLNNRTSEQIWRKSPDGTPVSRTYNTFIYSDGLLRQSTLIGYDANDKENSWLQNRYEYNSKRQQTEVTLYNKKGNRRSTTLRIYNDKGNLWKEVMIEYDVNGREKNRSGLEFSDRGAIVGEF